MRIGLLALVAALIVAAFGIPASAQENPGTCVSACGTDHGGSASGGDGGVTAVAFGSSGGVSTVTVTAAPEWLLPCDWTLLNPGDEIPAEFGDDGIFSEGPTEPTWVVTCPTSSILAVGYGDVATGILEIYPEGTMPDRLADAVIRQAVDQTPLVAFNPTSAPEGTRDAPLVTRFPTLLWIDEALWLPVTASASIPGLTVTATGTPVASVWAGGEEPPVESCEAGAPFDRSIDWEDHDFACSMVFLHSSTVEDYELVVEVTWDLTWECSAFCGSGSAGTDVTTGTRPVLVGEIQALTTCSGSGCGAN